ncbi:MAG: transporter [Thermoproteota archaeon]|nr:transporter [Thermoproteota archaeon]
MVLPYLFYFVQALGADVFTYGLILTSYSLMQFISAPIIARLSDRYGRRRILLFALLVSGLSYFVLGTANALWLIFLARMLSGTTAATVPVAQAYVADVTNENERIKYLGRLGAVSGIAFVSGSAIGGTLSGLFGYALPSFMASTFAFTNLVSAYFKLPEPEHAGRDPEKSAFTLKALRNLLKDRRMKILFAASFLFTVAFMFLQVVFPPWLQTNFGFGSFETGLMFFYIGIVAAVTQGVFLPKLSAKRSPATLVSYGLVILAAGFVALAAVINLQSLLLISILIPLGFGILNTALNTLISLSVPTEAQGGSLGIANSLGGLAQTITPAFATILYAFGQSIGLNWFAFIISGAITLSIIPIIASLRKQSKN